MTNIPLEDIAHGIRLAIDSKKIINHPRPYLGMSQLGHSCSRYLWYYFRLAALTQHEARKERIFRRGDLEEARIIQYLEDIGIEILSQQSSEKDCNGHLSGHTDGLVRNVPGLEHEPAVLLESKTMNEKAFKDVVRNKVQRSKPGYYVQVHTYMHYTETKYTLFIAVNKNTEELYIEIIKYDPLVAKKAIQRGADIISMAVPPKKLSEDPKYYECGWCDFKKQCHEMAPFLRTCRMCKHSKPHDNGNWLCTVDSAPRLLDFEAQKAACIKHDVLEI